jgi:hypothetical protein
MNEQHIECCRCHIPSSVLQYENKSAAKPRPWGWCGYCEIELLGSWCGMLVGSMKSSMSTRPPVALRIFTRLLKSGFRPFFKYRWIAIDDKLEVRAK